ncbi:MAG TPA: Hpt domain-containing protein [Pseudolabrys sp.]|nr:Hpt domain-containing protein [Pseudolabrys sp.]
MPKQKDKSTIANCGDHDVILPENRLNAAVINGSTESEDPVARAEKALAGLSSQFGSWMDSECARLDAARSEIRKAGPLDNHRGALFRAAHDIKGQAATFGYPAVAMAADSLCRLLEHTPEGCRLPLDLIDQHVDAVSAIYRAYALSDAKHLAETLTKRLSDATDEFLLRENCDRPEVTEQIEAPSISPK